MSSENIQWFYQHGTERKGPVSESDIQTLIKEGRINFGTLVWKNGFPEWLKIENTELKVHLNNVPPPLSTNAEADKKVKVNNIAVWFLAFGPILGVLAEYFFTGFINSGGDLGEIQAKIDMINHKYWYVVLIVNFALLFWDYQILKKANVDMKYIQKIIILIPVYLYKRAQMFNDNLAYFIVWIAAFILSLYI
jgi:hypothetical protein